MFCYIHKYILNYYRIIKQGISKVHCITVPWQRCLTLLKAVVKTALRKRTVLPNLIKSECRLHKAEKISLTGLCENQHLSNILCYWRSFQYYLAQSCHLLMKTEALAEMTKSVTVRRKELVWASTISACLGYTTATTRVCCVWAPQGCEVKDRPNRHRGVLGNWVREFKTVKINFASPLLRWQAGKLWWSAGLLLYIPCIKMLLCLGRLLKQIQHSGGSLQGNSPAL